MQPQSPALTVSVLEPEIRAPPVMKPNERPVPASGVCALLAYLCSGRRSGCSFEAGTISGPRQFLLGQQVGIGGDRK